MSETVDDFERLRAAIGFAARKHQHQLRKDHRTPYVAHPMRLVARLLWELDVKDVDVLCAAVLHDAIEDTTTDYDDVCELAGETVARWVAALTHDKRLPEAERERRYRDEVARAPWQVRLVKLVDAYDNVLDADALQGEKRERFLANKRGELEALTRDLPERFAPFVDKVRAKLAQPW
jgi:guanosine-3',5'-bis(diphosphate) 3'-pyrophosphohydrolase